MEEVTKRLIIQAAQESFVEAMPKFKEELFKELLSKAKEKANPLNDYYDMLPTNVWAVEIQILEQIIKELLGEL